MNDWNALLQAALVGSERPWSLPVHTQEGAPDPVALMLRDAHAQSAPDAPGLLLRLAGAKAVCQRAGWTAPATPIAPVAPASPESRTLANTAWSTLLSQAVNLGPQRLQHQVLFAMDTAALRAPPALLPALLHAGHQSVALRTHLLPLLGERGRWLAQQNPEWAYACGAQEQADTQTHWAHSSLEQRCAVLRTERTSAPAAARERLQADWESLPAKDRAALIATLHVGLCADDEAFLTLQLKDRAIDVRRTAADLLAALPSSAYSQRMVARMQALVQSEQAGPGLVGRLLGRVLSGVEPRWTVQAPDKAEADWKADQLEPERPKYEPLGERAWLLFQLTSRTPLAWWTQHTGLTPAGVLALAKASDWNDALLRGWQHAMLWQPDAAWAQALLDSAPAARWDGRSSLLALLAPQQREQYHLAQLAASTNLHEVAVSCLDGCAPHAHLGQAVSERLAQLLRQHIDQGALVNDYSLRNQLPDLACALHPQALTKLANLPRSAEETTSLSEALTLLEQVLHSRQQLIRLTAST
jgi:hypothetical protein